MWLTNSLLYLPNWRIWQYYIPLCGRMGFPGGSNGKESVYNAGDQGQSLGGEDPLEKEMATHCSILAWEISWTEEPGGLQSIGCKELDTTEQLTCSGRNYLFFLTKWNYFRVICKVNSKLLTLDLSVLQIFGSGVFMMSLGPVFNAFWVKHLELNFAWHNRIRWEQEAKVVLWTFLPVHDTVDFLIFITQY